MEKWGRKVVTSPWVQSDIGRMPQSSHSSSSHGTHVQHSLTVPPPCTPPCSPFHSPYPLSTQRPEWGRKHSTMQRKMRQTPVHVPITQNECWSSHPFTLSRNRTTENLNRPVHTCVCLCVFVCHVYPKQYILQSCGFYTFYKVYHAAYDTVVNTAFELFSLCCTQI